MLRASGRSVCPTEPSSQIVSPRQFFVTLAPFLSKLSGMSQHCPRTDEHAWHSSLLTNRLDLTFKYYILGWLLATILERRKINIWLDSVTTRQWFLPPGIIVPYQSNMQSPPFFQCHIDMSPLAGCNPWAPSLMDPTPFSCSVSSTLKTR